jgi:hypothetical protein
MDKGTGKYSVSKLMSQISDKTDITMAKLKGYESQVWTGTILQERSGAHYVCASLYSACGTWHLIVFTCASGSALKRTKQFFGLQEVDVAILKATLIEEVEPKEKHVRSRCIMFDIVVPPCYLICCLRVPCSTQGGCLGQCPSWPSHVCRQEAGRAHRQEHFLAGMRVARVLISIPYILATGTD